MLTLLLDEGLSIQDLVELAIEFVPVAFQLICLGSDMLVDIIKGSHQDQVNLLCHCRCILFDMLHLRHDLLEFLLNDMLFLCK